jgi:hypothetical protein
MQPREFSTQSGQYCGQILCFFFLFLPLFIELKGALKWRGVHTALLADLQVTCGAAAFGTAFLARTTTFRKQRIGKKKKHDFADKKNNFSIFFSQKILTIYKATVKVLSFLDSFQSIS